MMNPLQASGVVEKKLVEGLTTARIESLADNIFGFAMTLLTLNLLIPANLPSEKLGELFVTLWPQFLTYCMSFMVLGVFWIGCHSLFRWIRHVDRELLWLYISFLALIVLIPFTTALLRTYYMVPIALVAYGINVIVCGLMLYWFWTHATKSREVMSSEVTDEVIFIMNGRILVPVAGGSLVTLMAFFAPVLSLFFFAGLFVLATMPTTSDRVATAILGLFKKG